MWKGKSARPKIKLFEKLATPLISMAVMLVYRALLCGSRKYPYHHHKRDWIFQGGGGGSICLIFQKGEGVHHREIFPEGSRDA